MTATATHELIHLKVSQDSTGGMFADLSPADAGILAKNLSRLALAFIRKRLPDRQATAEVTDEYVEGLIYGSPPGPVELVSGYLYGVQDDPALMSEEFDVEAFLAAHPPG